MRCDNEYLNVNKTYHDLRIIHSGWFYTDVFVFTFEVKKKQHTWGRKIERKSRLIQKKETFHFQNNKRSLATQMIVFFMTIESFCCVCFSSEIVFCLHFLATDHVKWNIHDVFCVSLKWPNCFVQTVSMLLCSSLLALAKWCTSVLFIKKIENQNMFYKKKSADSRTRLGATRIFMI